MKATAFSLLFTSVSAVCSTAADCSLGGACIASACVCRTEWRGENCSQLSLLPALSGVAFKAPNTSSWGGSVARVGNLYFMALAEMQAECGLASWESNSAIRLAVAPSPEGPFERMPGPLLLGFFSHNPTLHT